MLHRRSERSAEVVVSAAPLSVGSSASTRPVWPTCNNIHCVHLPVFVSLHHHALSQAAMREMSCHRLYRGNRFDAVLTALPGGAQTPREGVAGGIRCGAMMGVAAA